jgi:hypothetical protein
MTSLESFREQEVYRIFNVIGQNAKVPVIFLISFTALLTTKLVFFNGFQSIL